VSVASEFTPVQLPQGEEILLAVAGGFHSVAVMKSGKVYAWGMNKFGQIGQPSENVHSASLPQRVRIPAPPATPSHLKTKDGDWRVVGADAGEHHTVLVTCQGEVLTFGSNAVGQLGRVTHEGNTAVPTAVDFSASIVALRGRPIVTTVCCGPTTTFAVTSGGHVFGWGGSSNGELGIHQGIVGVPRHIVLPSSLNHSYKVVKVAAGPFHTLLLTSTGEVFVSGDNGEGQLGIPGQAVFHTWRAIRHAHNVRHVSTNNHQSFFITAMGLLSECGTVPTSSPRTGSDTTGSMIAAPDLVYELKNVPCAGVTAAGSCVLIWTQGGDMWVRGTNHRGQLAVAHTSAVMSWTKIPKAKYSAFGVPLTLSLGRAHTLALFIPESERKSVEGETALNAMFVDADDVNSDSDDYAARSASSANEVLSKSCADESMNLSFSRAKPPALSFASANRLQPASGSPRSGELGEVPRAQSSPWITTLLTSIGIASLLGLAVKRYLDTTRVSER
jgi:alpha-tubulin suppressor-like RCC1 family protein